MTAIREDLLSISWKDKPEEKESPFSQDSCFLFLLVREAPLRPWPPWLAPSAHPSLVHLAAPLPSPRRQHHRGGPGACARSGLTRRQGAGHGFPSSAPALWRPSCPRLSPPQAPAWIRFLSNGLPLAAEGRWAPGWVSRAFLHLLTVEGAGRTMSEILCQWLNQEVKVSQTVSEWHGPGRAG